MGMWGFSPDYRVVLKQHGGKTWSLLSLQSCQAMLATTGGVGQFSAVFHDPTEYIKRTVQPHSMDLIQLWLKNRHGQWGKAWTGYLDTAHRAFDPDAGNTVHLTATSPYKLFEKTTQTPAQAAGFALALATNVTGSTVLQFACDAVRYPRSLLRIHPVADAGSGYGNLPDASVFTNPDAATWSTPLQALLNNTGLELFVDEAGRLYYRQMDFINPWMPGRPAIPRPVPDDDLLHADLFESDQTAVTRLEVRWGLTPIHQQGAIWQAPSEMEQHLGPRHVVIYRPDVFQKPTAQFIADSLGQQYAAGVLQGTVTLPADPLFGIGTLCRVPSLADGTQEALGIRLDAQSVYYISSVTYQLDWGSTWAMTLGLSFGRGHDQQFPYVHGISSPVPTKAQRLGLATNTTIRVIATDPHNNAQLTHPFAVVARPSLASDQVAVDPTIIPEGTVIAVKTALTNGSTVGPTLNGEYNAVKGVGISGYTVGLRSANATTGYVTLVTDGSSSPRLSGDTTGTTTSAPAPQDGTGRYTRTGPPQPFTGALPQTGNPYALRALQAAYSLKGRAYWPGTAGPQSWDCSGLVAWSYNQIGIPDMMVGANADVGPQREWDYFLTHGAVRIDPARAQPGDMLFIIEPRKTGSYPYPDGQCSSITGQCGFSHIAFCLAPGHNLGGDNTDIGVAVLPNAGFKSHFGTPFTDALNMSAFHP